MMAVTLIGSRNSPPSSLHGWCVVVIGQMSRQGKRHLRTPPSSTFPPLPLLMPSNPRLGYNHISAEGASALASLLYAGSSSVLESLELQGNRIGDAGALALANGFAGRGGITSATAAAAAGGSRRRDRRGGAKQQARPGSGLRSLNLAGNGIGCSGGVALAEALLNGGRKTTGGEGCVLEDLELAGNAVSLLHLLVYSRSIYIRRTSYIFCRTSLS